MADSQADCIFCKLVKGEIPCFKVYEDDQFLAFLDIAPLTRGHTLVVPKAHYRWVHDVPEPGQYFVAAVKVAQALEHTLKPDFVTYHTFGQDIYHAHIHVVPRYHDDNAGTPYQHVKHLLEVKYPEEQMAQIAKQLYHFASSK